MSRRPEEDVMTSPVQAPDPPSHPTLREQILELHGKLRRCSPPELLGLAPDADARSARAAFQALAKRFHPDSLGPADADLRDKAQAVLMEVSAAYDVVRAGLGSRPSAPSARPAAEERVAERRVATERPRARLVELPVVRLELPAERASLVAEHSAGPAPVPQRQPALAQIPLAQAPVAPPAAARTAAGEAAPAVAPRPRWREVEDAIEEAEQQLSRSESAAAIEALHAVLRLANERQRDRVRLLLARAYLYEPGKRRNALALLNEITREQPANAEALALLGSLYLREGLLGRAEAMLSRALVADPGHPTARATLREVRDTLNRRAQKKPRQSSPQSTWGGLVGRLLLMVR
jgi:hypothetical protein